jgi:hypothetical protein
MPTSPDLRFSLDPSELKHCRFGNATIGSSFVQVIEVSERSTPDIRRLDRPCSLIPTAGPGNQYTAGLPEMHAHSWEDLLVPPNQAKIGTGDEFSSDGLGRARGLGDNSN